MRGVKISRYREETANNDLEGFDTQDKREDFYWDYEEKPESLAGKRGHACQDAQVRKEKEDMRAKCCTWMNVEEVEKKHFKALYDIHSVSNKVSNIFCIVS